MKTIFRFIKWMIGLMAVMVMLPISSVRAFEPGYSVEQTGSSTVTWVEEGYTSGSHAIRFDWRDDYYAAVRLDVPDNLTILSITSWSYWMKTMDVDFSPRIEIFFIDQADGKTKQLFMWPHQTTLTAGNWINFGHDYPNYHVEVYVDGVYSFPDSLGKSNWAAVVADYEEAPITQILIGNVYSGVEKDITAYIDDFVMVVNGTTITYDFEMPPLMPYETVWVDPAGSCEDETPCFSSLQAGVNAVGAGGTVHVAPGTYDESITVNKPVDLLGANAGIHPNSDQRGPESTVTGGFTLESGSVTIDGFEVTGAGTAFEIPGAASGITFRNNRVEGVETGLLIHTHADPADPPPLASGLSFGDNWVESSGAAVAFSDIGSHPGGTAIQFANVVIHRNSLTRTTPGPVLDVPNDLDILDDPIDAAHNWWGSFSGPSPGQVLGPVTVEPWCGSGRCDFRVHRDDLGQRVITPLFDSNGQPIPINVPGGILLAEEGLSLLLKDGTVIHNDSPCFVVSASNTLITAESIGGASCIPTNNSHGIDVAGGLRNIEIYGLEILGIDGEGTAQQTGDGIHFRGPIENLWIAENKLHLLDGHGIHFSDPPTGTVDIRGNLFMDNGGFGVNAEADVDVRYNSWGRMTGPQPGVDLPEVITTFSPYTHAGLELHSDAPYYANTVVMGDEVRLDVYASLWAVWGAEVRLSYTAEALSVKPGSLATYGVFDIETLADTGGSITFHGFQIALDNGSGETPPGEPIQEPVRLFSVTIETVGHGRNLPLVFSEVNFSFAYQGSDVGSSNQVIAAQAADFPDFQVIALPEMTTDLPGGILTAASGVEETFTIQLSNPETGAGLENTWVKFKLDGAAAEDIHRMEFLANPSWAPATFEDDGAGNVIGWLGEGFTFQPGEEKTIEVRVVFKHAGSWPMDIWLEDVDSGWVLDSDQISVQVSSGEINVVGTVYMQGRKVRAGVPVWLISDPGDGLPDFGTLTTVSTSSMEDNILFGQVNPGSYRVATNQPRYLNLRWAHQKTLTLEADFRFASVLWLYGGDANGDDVINISDASIVGAQYGSGGIEDDGDINFDGRVNIQDLALVGGNYGLTSAAAYGDWSP